jgi:hypothetical protein
MGQLHALHGRLDPPDGMTPDHDFVRGENQAESLFLLVGVAFGENKLVEGKQQGTPRGGFDAEGASVGITRPTFGWLGGVHGVAWLSSYGDEAVSGGQDGLQPADRIAADV